MRIRVYFSPHYVSIDTPLLARLAVTAARLKQLEDLEFVTPVEFDTALLSGLHSKKYIDAFLHGREPLASSQGIRWTASIRDATLAMLGGQVEGTKCAMEYGIAMNVARGFHHAVRDRGSGYCPVNGLALVAHCFTDKKILVLDCDEHGGNGTEEFAAEIPNLFNISIFGTRFGCLGGKRSWAFHVPVKTLGFKKYMDALEAAEEIIAEVRPDIILYQAGADCHQHDPKSSIGLTTEEMYQRDIRVFTMTKNRSIPILFLVAGGYQDPKKVAELNANTVRAAQSLYS